jgi:hypothetical protein
VAIASIGEPCAQLGRVECYFLAPHFFAAQAPHFLVLQGLAKLHGPAEALQRARQAPPAQPASAAAVTTAQARVRERSSASELMEVSSGG